VGLARGVKLGLSETAVATRPEWGYIVPNQEVDMAKRASSDIVNLKLRFPEAMRQRIEQEAKRNNRSLNGEIVYRLGTTFGEEGVALVDQYEMAQKEIKRLLEEIVQSFKNKGAPTPPKSFKRRKL
jgi:hypothetical protein